MRPTLGRISRVADSVTFRADRRRGRLNPAALFASLDRTPPIVGTDPRHGALRRDTTHRRQQGQRRPGPTDAAATGDLDALLTGPLPRFTQRRRRIFARVGQSEVSPADPSVGPRAGRRVSAKEIDGKVRSRRRPARLTNPAATDASPIRHLHHARLVGPQVHASTLITTSATQRRVGREWSIRHASGADHPAGPGRRLHTLLR